MIMHTCVYLSKVCSPQNKNTKYCRCLVHLNWATENNRKFCLQVCVCCVYRLVMQYTAWFRGSARPSMRCCCRSVRPAHLWRPPYEQTWTRSSPPRSMSPTRSEVSERAFFSLSAMVWNIKLFFTAKWKSMGSWSVPPKWLQTKCGLWLAWCCVVSWVV